MPGGESQDSVSEQTPTDGLKRCEEAGRVRGEMRDEIGFFFLFEIVIITILISISEALNTFHQA